jgi:hypothetical protein
MWRTGRDLLAGSALVFIGVLLLAERRFPELVPVIPLVVGLAILGVFLVRRTAMLLLVGCVLAGAGVGVLVDAGGGPGTAGVGFLACLAAGFAVAWLLAIVLQVPGLRPWVLVAAALIGGLAAVVAVSGRGETLQRIVIAWWPLAIVVLGVALLIAARGRGRGPDDETRVVPAVAISTPEPGSRPMAPEDVPSPPHRVGVVDDERR